jgi:hypothetical protein
LTVLHTIAITLAFLESLSASLIKMSDISSFLLTLDSSILRLALVRLIRLGSLQLSLNTSFPVVVADISNIRDSGMSPTLLSLTPLKTLLTSLVKGCEI